MTDRAAAAPDAALVRRVLDGDVEAYAVLVTRYRSRYVRFATHMLGSVEDAEEALQDAFVRAYRSLARCEDPERFGSWLFRILVNRCRTAGARRGRRERTIVHGGVAPRGAAEDDAEDAVAGRPGSGGDVRR